MKRCNHCKGTGRVYSKGMTIPTMSSGRMFDFVTVNHLVECKKCHGKGWR